MMVFFVRAEPVEPPGQDASAYVVAEDADEAMILLRKDLNFSGYRLPPAELTACPAETEAVRRALGDAASREKGVYGFDSVQRLGPPPH